MNRLFVLTGVLACAIIASTSATGAEDDKEVKTSAIMKKCFGKAGLCKTCLEQGKKMDWDDAAKTAKEFYEVVSNLPKGEPKKGEKSDFVKTAKSFVGKVKGLKTAIDNKDEKKFAASAKAVTSSCKGCHTAHR